jgi:hypothetical protein
MTVTTTPVPPLTTDGKFIIFWLVFTPIEIKTTYREIHISLLMAIKFAIIFQNEILSILHKYI